MNIATQENTILEIMKTDSSLILISSVSQPIVVDWLGKTHHLDLTMVDLFDQTHVNNLMLKPDFNDHYYIVFSYTDRLLVKAFAVFVDRLLCHGPKVIITSDRPYGKALKCFKHRLAQQPLLIEV